MEHDEAVEHDVATRYLSGRLTPAECAAFEEHFIDCPTCLDALESADDLQLGLKAVVAQDARAGGGVSSVRPSRGRRVMTVAAGIAAAVIVAVGAADLVRTRRELARVSEVAAAVSGQSDRAQALIRSLSDRVQQLESASRTASTAVGPSSAPVFALTTVRGGAAPPPNRVTVTGAPDWIVLSLELDDPDTSGRFRAVLRDAQRRETWRDERLQASSPGTLALALRRSLLAEGDYTLDIDRQPPNAVSWTPAGRYAFRVAR